MRDEIIEMAKEAGFNVGTAPQIERFYDLAVQHERDAIYDIVMLAPFNEAGEEDIDNEIGTALKAMAFSIMSKIKARGEKQ